MRNRIPWIILAAAVLIGAANVKKPEQVTRPCIPASGHATSLADISSSSGTGELDAYTVYGVYCTGATLIRWELGDSSAATADANSNLMSNDTLWYFMTGGEGVSRYFSAVDSATTAGSCELFKCL